MYATESRKQFRAVIQMIPWAFAALGLSLWAADGFASEDGTTRGSPKPSPHATAGVTYEDVTAGSGLDRFQYVAGDPLRPYLPDSTGSGLALFDYNNDGWLDVYLINALSHNARRGEEPAVPSSLFRNNHNGTFTDVTREAGVANSRWGTGVCVGDYDNDGWADLYLGNLGETRLFRNDGDGTFRDVAKEAGVVVDTWTTGCAFGDYNRDGLLDLYVAGYVDFDWQYPPPPGESTEDSTNQPAASPRSDRERSEPSRGTGAAYQKGLPFCTFLGFRVACGPLGLAGAPDFLFRNNGDGTFTDVTREARVVDKDLYYGFSVAWVDVDDDGWQDLLVANDSRPNYLYHNQRDGTFEEVGFLSGLATNADGKEQAYMGMTVGDYNRDGRNDFFFTTFSEDSYTLQRNNGGIDFTEVTQLAGLGVVTLPFLGWGAEFLDYDNDAWLDIFAANGHIYVQVDQHSPSSTFKQRPLMFRNLGDGTFTEVTGSFARGALKPTSSRGAAVGDLLNDGDLDLVINNIDGAPTLLQNNGGNQAGHWITLKLVGEPSRQTPRDAIGAVVFCQAGGFVQRGEVASGRGYISQSDLRVHFGLGSVNTVDRLEILWPNGAREVVSIPSVNHFYTILQGKGIQENPPASVVPRQAPIN